MSQRLGMKRHTHQVHYVGQKYYPHEFHEIKLRNVTFHVFNLLSIIPVVILPDWRDGVSVTVVMTQRRWLGPGQEDHGLLGMLHHLGCFFSPAEEGIVELSLG